MVLIIHQKEMVLIRLPAYHGLRKWQKSWVNVHSGSLNNIYEYAYSLKKLFIGIYCY